MKALIGAMALSAVIGAVAAPMSASAMELHPSIVGGAPVRGNDPIAKSIVALKAGGALCTGSIIDDDLIVTAAHCVDGAVSKMSVVFGLSASDGKTARVVGKEVPAEYSGHATGRDQYDIALIRFEGPLPSGYRKAKLLSAGAELSNGDRVVLAGYGITDALAGTGSGELRKTAVKIKDAGFARTEVLLDQTEGTGACHGDSGGPAFVEEGGALAVWGVTNRAYPNDAPDDCAHESVYTDIRAHSEWLGKAAARLRR